MTAKEYLEGLPAKIKPEDVEGVDTIMNFDLKGEEYHITVKDGAATFNQGLVEEAEVTLTTKPEDLVKIVQGDLNPMKAMMFGKLKVNNPSGMLKYAKMLNII